jgi:Raf kinase inhibitor-like YbhB/YbcL family protein
MNTTKADEATKAIDYKFLNTNSEAFLQNKMIPENYTCDGININPPLHIDGIPEEAKSIAIIVDDPDAPKGSFCHWVAWNIPVTHQIKEKEKRGLHGQNDFGNQMYNGPCPPSGTHRYYFKVYALDCTLAIAESSNKTELEKAMTDHIVGFGVLVGKYKKQISSHL